MENKVKDLLYLLLFSAKIDFGAVNLSDAQKEFRNELDNEVISLCNDLPKSTREDALSFFMERKFLGNDHEPEPERGLFHESGGGNFPITSGQEFSFFMNYYVPAWSIIYWLIRSVSKDKELEREDMQNGKKAHAMALFLHPLDDHLNDGQVSATHLTVLLRSHAWMIMNAALNRLAHGVDGGEEIVRGLMNDYYSSIRGSKDIQSLERYCDHFRKQMATWLIVPVLMAKKMRTNEEFANAIQAAYGSFGIAWRLLDDIKDIETDMIKGAKSSIYICLPKDIRNYWKKKSGEELDKKNGYLKVILDYILEHSVIERIRETVCSKLDSAASIADDCNMTNWADECRSLLRPFKNSGGLS
jgi:hypothetical protein